MPKTQISCPNCRQPVTADVNQLFDMNVDPQAKARLLSGSYNLIQCPSCGYQGNLASPIVYHDPEKELLLTFVPPEMGLPRNEQERLIGSLINQVVSKLPQEKRKGYLLNPSATLTMQGLIERILEGDGITREMMQAQQARMSLLQRLVNASDQATLEEIARQEDAIIDADFFSLLNRLAEISMMQGDRQGAQLLGQLQQSLLPITTYGREIQAQSQEVEAAINDLRAAGQDLDQAKLLELIINAPNETRLNALVSFARAGMDYTFFELLTRRIEAAQEPEKARLQELRVRLLQMTQEIDKAREEQRQEIRRAITAIAQSKDIPQAMGQILGAIDENFVRELQTMQDEARKAGDLEKLGKYGEMIQVLQEASAPPEMGMIEEYLEQGDETARQAWLEQHREAVTQEVVDLMSNIAMQVQQSQTTEDRAFAEQVIAAHRQMLKFNMAKGLSA
jgi:hypothetical protein